MEYDRCIDRSPLYRSLTSVGDGSLLLQVHPSLPYEMLAPAKDLPFYPDSNR